MIAFQSLFQVSPLYRALVQSHTRSKPNPRMGMLTRPTVNVWKQKRVWGTAGNIYRSENPGDVFKIFGKRRAI